MQPTTTIQPTHNQGRRGRAGASRNRGGHRGPVRAHLAGSQAMRCLDEIDVKLAPDEVRAVNERAPTSRRDRAQILRDSALPPSSVGPEPAGPVLAWS